MDGKSEAHCAPLVSEPSSGCTSCAQIIEFSTNAKDRARTVLGSASSLIDTKCPHREWFKRFVPDNLRVKGPVELSLCKFGSSIQLQRNGEPYSSPTGLCELVYRECTGRGRGRVLDPSWINEGVILNWKDLCSQHHKNACENPISLGRADPVQPTWLIDTTDGCLVPGRREMRYVALSYVRGAAGLLCHEKCNTDQLQKPGVLVQGDLAKRLPRTIKDAIAVIPLLGERFLWVDLLCIVHDDMVSLQTELDAMSRIYKSSYFTVIAADGTDANYGLRGFKGLTSPRKLQQTIIPLAGPEMLIAPRMELDLWKKAYGVYHSRAWTYQEYIFAKRRLVFAHGTIYWECGRCHWDEELIPNLPPPVKADHSWHLPDHFQSTDLFRKTSMPDMTSLNSLVSNFNQKALTSPHDALSAFSGMQWVLGQAFPGGLLYGIPEFFFEAGLMWIPSGVTERRRSTTRSRFESQLPSWSFLGWQGGVNFTPDCEFHAHPNRRAEIMIGISRPITTWYTMSHPVTSEKRQIKSNWHGYKIRGRNLAKELPEKSPLYPFGPDDGYPAPGSTMGYSEGIRVPKKPDLSTELPKGWGLFQFGPNAGYNAPGNTMGYSEVDGPREYGYRHDSDIERYDLVESHTYYRYPVPVQHEATQHTLPPQTQFLSCKTSRAFLHGISKIPTDNSFTISRLYLEGKNIGFVTQMPLEHKEICAKDTKPEDALFELVAISEGWACWDDEGDNDRKTKFWSRSDGKQCYHVICIGWEENIAYRRGIGCVLKETWEEVREEEQVDLILG